MSLHFTPFRFAAALAASLLATGAHAQAPVLTGLSPARNALAVPASAPVVFTFSQPLANTPATYNAPRLFSQQIGAGLYTSRPVAGNTLTVVPARPFVAGETVSATLAAGVLASNGQTLASPQVFQFTVATKPSSGVFGGGSDLVIGTSHVDIVTGDVDGDGDLDVLTVNGGNGDVTIGLNNGDGTYSPSPTAVFVGGNLVNASLGDLDSDGDLDMVVTTFYRVGRPGSAAVYFNNGKGSFSLGSSVPLGLIINAGPAVLGDVDGDGDLDLVGVGGTGTISDNNYKQGVLVQTNDGRGTFGGSQFVAAYALNLALGDADGDGDLDLFTVSDQVSLSLNNGQGIFGASQPLGLSAAAGGLVLGDLDGDGDLDLVAANQAVGTVGVGLNNGAGTFTSGGPVVFTTSSAGYVLSIALGDVDGDGDLDLVGTTMATTSTASVRLNSGQGSFAGTQEVSLPVPAAFRQFVLLRDVDGDGDLDLLAGSSDSNNIVSVRLNQPLAPVTTATITRLRAGGPALSTSRGQFAADQYYSPSSAVGGTSKAIANTPDQALYQQERYSTNGTLSYAVPVVNGQYQVVLHFAEIYWTQPGQRVFDGYLESKKVLDHYDIIKHVGPLAASTESFNVTVADGTLNLDLRVPYLSGGADQAKLSALEIISTDPNTRLRAGGAALTTTRGQFAADQYYSTSSQVGGTSKPISGTADQALYQQERYSTNGTLSYAVPVANGQYAVTLHFAELYWTEPGQRVFDGYLENQKVLDHYDIVQKAGPLAATTETFTVTVTDGVLNLDLSVPYLTGGADQAKLSALEVLRVGTTSAVAASNLRSGAASLLTAAASLSTYPNPSAGAFTLAYTTETPQAATLLLTDPLGRVLHQQAVALQAGDNQVAVRATTAPAGLYRLTLCLANGQTQSRQVLIQP